MATTIITVKLDEQPLPGAQVCIGEYLERFVTTDENGQISRDMDDGFAIVAPVSVRHQSIGTTMGSVMLIEAGGDYLLNLHTPDY